MKQRKKHKRFLSKKFIIITGWLIKVLIIQTLKVNQIRIPLVLFCE